MDPDTSTNDQTPPLIPDHRLLRRIGRGSYGTVWLARNMMGMYRAVKIVYRKSFEDQRPFERELSGIRKFEPVSRSHEGFVDVLHVGINEAQGYFYYVMELGDDENSGQNIDPECYAPKTLNKELSAHGKVPVQECLRLGLALSQALAELHKQGLVHRDVKPSNIIFVNGIPKLADIGLVAEVSEARSYVGTEGFIPPEGPGTPQADVYGLGKVLYEISTGKDRQDFPELPTQLDKFTDSTGFLELNEVILQACKNDVTKRYPSAWDMHADLVVLANGKSVKRLKMLERRLSTLKRVAGVSAGALVMLAAVSYTVYREWNHAMESRQRQVGADVAYGNRSMESGDLLGALPYFADALRLDKGNVSQETTDRLRFGLVLAQCPKLTRFWSTDIRINDGEFSPDGNQILVAEFFGRARIYDLQTGELYGQPFGEGQGLTSVSYCFDGRRAVTASEDSIVRVWDLVTFKKICELPHPDKVFCARFSPDGLRIVTSCKDGQARVWDLQTLQPVLTIRHKKEVLFANFSPDGRRIVTASKDKTACIWDATNGALLQRLLEHKDWVNYAAFSPDGTKIVTACADHVVRVWKADTGARILPDLNHGDGVWSAQFSPDGRYILTASLDGTVRLWFADSMKPLDSNPILRHSGRVTHACFSPDGRRVLTTCADGSVRIWDLAGSATPPAPVSWSSSQDGSRFLAITKDGVEIRDAAHDEVVSAFIPVGSPVEKAQFSPKGRFVLITSIIHPHPNETSRLLQVQDAANGQAIGQGITVSNSFVGATLSDDGKRLMTFAGNIVKVWDVGSGASVALSHHLPVSSVFFSSDGKRVGTTSGNELRVWDAATGHGVLGPLGLPLPISYAEFSPDEGCIVACCSDPQLTECFAQVWSAADGRPIGAQLKHRDGVLFASFSPESRRLVTACENFTATVWDVVTGRQLTPDLRHEEKVQSACFDPAGRWIVTASSDKTARIWNADTGDPLTPPLRHLTTLTGARFLTGERRIFTFNSRGNAWIWDLPVDARPVEDLTKLARLLSGGTVRLPGELAATQSEYLEAIWQRLRIKHPSQFAVTAQDIAAWHEFEAEKSEMDGQWFAATFHLEHLLSIQSGDRSLEERLAAAKEHLKTGL